MNNYTNIIKTEVVRLVDLETRYEKNIPFDSIIIENYRKNISQVYLAELGDSIESSGLLQAVGLLEVDDKENDGSYRGKYELIFGQCRTLACEKFTSFEMLPDAKIWPKEAKKFIKSISFIENFIRKEVDINDDIVGLNDILKTEYEEYAIDERRKAFSAQTGITQKTITMRLKIAEAMELNSTFKKIALDGIVKDVNTLYDIAKSILIDLSPKKNILLQTFLSLVKENDLSGTINTKAIEIRNYNKKNGKKPKIEAKSDTDKKTHDLIKPKSEIKKKPLQITLKQINNLKIKFNCEDVIIDDNAKQAIRELIDIFEDLLNNGTDEKIQTTISN